MLGIGVYLGHEFQNLLILQGPTRNYIAIVGKGVIGSLLNDTHQQLTFT